MAARDLVSDRFTVSYRSLRANALRAATRVVIGTANVQRFARNGRGGTVTVVATFPRLSTISQLEDARLDALYRGHGGEH